MISETGNFSSGPRPDSSQAPVVDALSGYAQVLRQIGYAEHRFEAKSVRATIRVDEVHVPTQRARTVPRPADQTCAAGLEPGPPDG